MYATICLDLKCITPERSYSTNTCLSVLAHDDILLINLVYVRIIKLLHFGF